MFVDSNIWWKPSIFIILLLSPASSPFLPERVLYVCSNLSPNIISLKAQTYIRFWLRFSTKLLLSRWPLASRSVHSISSRDISSFSARPGVTRSSWPCLLLAYRTSQAAGFPSEASYPFSVLSAATAKSLQSCPTLCDPRDGSPPGSPVPGILQARTLEWVAISFSNAWKWKVKVKSLSRVWLLATPWTAAHQAPPSMGFSRQEYWSGVPLPSPIF